MKFNDNVGYLILVIFPLSITACLLCDLWSLWLSKPLLVTKFVGFVPNGSKKSEVLVCIICMMFYPDALAFKSHPLQNNYFKSILCKKSFWILVLTSVSGCFRHSKIGHFWHRFNPLVSHYIHDFRTIENVYATAKSLSQDVIVFRQQIVQFWCFRRRIQATNWIFQTMVTIVKMDKMMEIDIEI